MIEQVNNVLFSDLAGEFIRWGLIGALAIYVLVYYDGKLESEPSGCLAWIAIGVGTFIIVKGKEMWFMVMVYILVLGILIVFLIRCFDKFIDYMIKKDKEDNFRRTKKEAEKGADSYTYYELAEIYEKGKGVKRSLKQAEKWYRKAAECGNAKMKREFGKRFEKGDHIARNVDMEEAQRWYAAADKWEKEHNKK